MSKRSLVGLLVYAGGLLTGFGLAQMYLETKFEKITQDEIDSYRRAKQREVRALQSEICVLRGEPDPSEIEAYSPKKDDGKEESIEKFKTGKIVDYTSYFNGEPRERNKVLSEEELAEREHPEDDVPDDEDAQEDLENEAELAYLESEAYDRMVKEEAQQAELKIREPYPITYAQFVNEKDWYRKVACTLFEIDNVVVDEDGDIVEDPEQCFSPCYRAYFGKGDDPDTVYIRNDKTAYDYEIHRVEQPYAQCPVISFSSDE